jgi:hypothetical protein
MERLVASIAASGLIASLLLGVPAAAADDERVEGSWYITVQVTEPSPATFDALYGFAKGGVFTRIDGRNNASALGTWKRTEDGGNIFSNLLFNFTDGVRTGYITGEFAARVVAGTLTGTFTAEATESPAFSRGVAPSPGHGSWPKPLRASEVGSASLALSADYGFKPRMNKEANSETIC